MGNNKGSHGPIGAFSTAADVASIAGVWGSCLYTIAKDEGYKLDKDTAKKICKSALLGMGGYYAGCKLANKIFMAIPGAGWLVGMGVSTAANMLFTYRFVLTLCAMLKKNKKKGKSVLDVKELGEDLKSMFKGNGVIDDIIKMTEIYKS